MSFKNETLRWDDVRVFLAVARAEGLAGAARETRISSATLGRHINALEEACHGPLFQKSQQGYQLTSLGTSFWEQAVAMETQAKVLERWCQNQLTPTVRIACGRWTGKYLIKHVLQMDTSEDLPLLQILPANAFVSMSHRSAELAIRNQRPRHSSLIVQTLGSVEFAVYGHVGYVRAHPEALNAERYQACDWVAPTAGANAGASTRWIHGILRKSPKLSCGTSDLVLDGVLAGVGLGVLPVFFADDFSELRRCSEPVVDLASPRYLVSHADDRLVAHIRVIRQNLVTLFRT